MSDAAVELPTVLRIAVLASTAAEQNRLAVLVGQCGHRLVELSASPDAILTDGTAAATLPAVAVAVGAVDGAFAGRLPSDAGAAQVDAALRAVAAGLTVRATAPPPRNFESLTEEEPALLTPREIEVLAALGNGFTNKETARLLGISPHTVKFHIESLFRKLGVASRAEAVVKGMRQQIVEF
jgi:two-component system nitrate/nitrite response regulator NarL